jgi:hypothetical protein
VTPLRSARQYGAPHPSTANALRDKLRRRALVGDSFLPARRRARGYGSIPREVEPDGRPADALTTSNDMACIEPKRRVS